MTESSPAALSYLEEKWQTRMYRHPDEKTCWEHLDGVGEAQLPCPRGALALACPAVLSPGGGCGKGGVVFRATLAGRCELHPAAQIKGTSAGHIHQKAFNAQPQSREIYSGDSFPCLKVRKLCQPDIQETLLNTFLFI